MNQSETYEHYQLLRREDGSLWELGRGAMGITYKAFDVNLRCEVALKVINAVYLHSETARARFIREARAAAALRHRNVAGVHHLCVDGETFFYAMEFIDGETVETWVRRGGPLPPITALRITLQVVRALGAAAKQQLVHRDIKPANLMIVHEDDDEHFLVKLIDFGLARPLFGTDSPTATVNGFVGTPVFASPEQLEEKEVDSRSDIYSLGVTLWYMLAAKPPFSGPISSILYQHANQEPPWEQLAHVPEAARALLARMLQKEPGRRPQSPAELREELADCLRTVLAALPPDDDAAVNVEDEELPAAEMLSLAPGSSGSGTDATRKTAEPEEPVPGMMLAGRYRLVQLAGEGNSGQVFEANDIREGHRPVALKILHPDLLVTAEDSERLKEAVDHVRSAPHPRLLEILALERTPRFTFLAAEWVQGFTLVGLLRKRGVLTVVECLLLLRQIAEAVDHALSRGLTGLELALHQILVHFPSGLRLDDPAGQSVLRAPLTEWPEFTLKIDPLCIGCEISTLVQPAGEITLVPPMPRLNHDTQLAGGVGVGGEPDAGNSGGGRSNLYSHALGILVYELLGGRSTPSPSLLAADGNANADGSAGAESNARRFALPILGEAGNAVLRRCLSSGSGFASGGEFFTALARATGFDPADLRPVSVGLPAGSGSRSQDSAAVVPPRAVPAAAPAAIQDIGEGATTLQPTRAGTKMATRPAVAEPGIGGESPLNAFQRVARADFSRHRRLAGGLAVTAALAAWAVLIAVSRDRPLAPPPARVDQPVAVVDPAPPAATPAAAPAAEENPRPLLTLGGTGQDLDAEGRPSPTTHLFAPSAVTLDDAVAPGGTEQNVPASASTEDSAPAPSASAAGEETEPAASPSPTETPKPAATRTRSRHGSSSRQRQSAQPNFWQRVFGIKPKPTPKPRSHH